jgi:hypothetical protein
MSRMMKLCYDEAILSPSQVLEEEHRSYPIVRLGAPAKLKNLHSKIGRRVDFSTYKKPVCSQSGGAPTRVRLSMHDEDDGSKFRILTISGYSLRNSCLYWSDCAVSPISHAAASSSSSVHGSQFASMPRFMDAVTVRS